MIYIYLLVAFICLLSQHIQIVNLKSRVDKLEDKNDYEIEKKMPIKWGKQYYLNCKNCGKAYWCNIAYPIDQLCEECIGGTNNDK